MEFTIKSSLGTFGLIIINIIIFLMFGFTASPADDTAIFQCMQQGYPQCLIVDQNYSQVAQCMSQNPSNSSACIYSVKQECANNPQITQACYPQAWQNSQNLSFTPALFGQGKNIYAVFTSMFMHANWPHLIGNMVFLLLVGVFIERRLGTPKFLSFYVLVGLCSTLVYFLFNQGSANGLLGASGAISGLMGANLILDFFRSGPEDAGAPFFRPQTLILFIFYQFIFQMFVGGSSVAYVAHIGGFFVGALLIFYFKKKDEVYMAEPTY